MPSDKSPEKQLSEIEEREAGARIMKLTVETQILEQQAVFNKQEGAATLAKTELETRLLTERAPADAEEGAARLAKLEVEKRVLLDQLGRGFRLRECAAPPTTPVQPLRLRLGG